MTQGLSKKSFVHRLHRFSRIIIYANDELRITTKNLIFNLIQINKTTLVAGSITPRTNLIT